MVAKKENTKDELARVKKELSRTKAKLKLYDDKSRRDDKTIAEYLADQGK